MVRSGPVHIVAQHVLANIVEYMFRSSAGSQTFDGFGRRRYLLGASSGAHGQWLHFRGGIPGADNCIDQSTLCFAGVHAVMTY